MLWLTFSAILRQLNTIYNTHCNGSYSKASANALVCFGFLESMLAVIQWVYGFGNIGLSVKYHSLKSEWVVSKSLQLAFRVEKINKKINPLDFWIFLVKLVPMVQAELGGSEFLLWLLGKCKRTEKMQLCIRKESIPVLYWGFY